MGYHSIQKANYMKKSLIKNDYVIPNDDSSLREFLLEVKTNASDVINKMGDKGFLAGIYYDEKHVLVAVTEKRKKIDIDGVTKEDIFLTLKKKESRNLKVFLKYNGPIKAPITKDQEIAKIEIYVKNILV